MNAIHHVIGTFFGTGHAPFASGTVGSAAIAAVVFALTLVVPPEWYLATCLALAAFYFVLGVPAGTWCERRWGKDPSQCVADEVVGFLIGVAWLTPPDWRAIVAAFFLFRLFDVGKVYPANRLERLPGGWGIMLDDVVAGLYTLAAMVPIRVFLWP